MLMLYSVSKGIACKEKPEYTLSSRFQISGPIKNASVSIKEISEKFVGRSRSHMLLQKIFGSSFIRYKNILETQIAGEIEEAGGKLRKSQQIKNFLLISSYKGLRHKANMPVRGQRTHTNAKTRRKYKIN